MRQLVPSHQQRWLRILVPDRVNGEAPASPFDRGEDGEIRPGRAPLIVGDMAIPVVSAHTRWHPDQQPLTIKVRGAGRFFGCGATVKNYYSRGGTSDHFSMFRGRGKVLGV